MGNKTRKVKVGEQVIGGGSPVIIQTMWDKPLQKDPSDLLRNIQLYKNLGCGLIRFAVPDETSAELLGSLASVSPIPIVADIHFHYKLALKIMDYPIVKIRINPGNIGAEWKVREIVEKAMDKNIAIRVGANGGSLPSRFRNDGNIAQGMVEAVEEQLNILEMMNFRQIVVSLKSSDVDETVSSNKLFSERFDYPLHLGITEAGPIIPALVKSTLGLSRLLQDDIGDTLRISISDSPEKEIMAGKELLSVLGMTENKGVNIISCPKCGRSEFDTHGFTQKVQIQLMSIDKPLNIAIMGCPVNGPGEAKSADLGITGSGGEVFIFKNGKVVKRGNICQAEDLFWEELNKLL